MTLVYQLCHKSLPMKLAAKCKQLALILVIWISVIKYNPLTSRLSVSQARILASFGRLPIPLWAWELPISSLGISRRLIISQKQKKSSYHKHKLLPTLLITEKLRSIWELIILPFRRLISQRCPTISRLSRRLTLITKETHVLFEVWFLKKWKITNEPAISRLASISQPTVLIDVHNRLPIWIRYSQLFLDFQWTNLLFNSIRRCQLLKKSIVNHMYFRILLKEHQQHFLVTHIRQAINNSSSGSSLQ